MFYRFCKIWVSLLGIICFRIKTVGREYVPKKGGIIIATNHASFLDPVLAGIACPRQLYFMARHDLFRNRFFGCLITMLHAFPLKRTGIDTVAFKIALQKLREGKAVLIFPEGTRSPDGELQEPEPGIGYLQNTSGLPILPCYIKGSGEALPRDAIFPRFRPIAVYFGKPLIFFKDAPIGSKRELYTAIAREAMQAIKKLRDDAD